MEEKELIKKSIFRQKRYQKHYELVYRSEQDRFIRQFSVINALISAKTVREDHLIEDAEVGRYDIEMPLLEVNDEIFLHDINKNVVVKKRMRSTDGSITYYIDDEFIETDETKASYEKANEEINKLEISENKVRNIIRENDSLRKENEELLKYKNLHPYQNRFFNF